MAALHSAGLRALAALPRTPDLVILDGNHDWLTALEEVGLLSRGEHRPPTVTTMIKRRPRAPRGVASARRVERVDAWRSLRRRRVIRGEALAGWGIWDYSALEHLGILAARSACAAPALVAPASFGDAKMLVRALRMIITAHERRGTGEVRDDGAAAHREYRDVVGLFSHVVETASGASTQQQRRREGPVATAAGSISTSP